ncbi:hypothetical protein SLS62_011023 [Diatrype stigma]|uniref:PH domain-containing protein n=1 Tax=Diatrype stigma TaxID=117547 RepID=A0AAN9U5P5_9PEZI
MAASSPPGDYLSPALADPSEDPEQQDPFLSVGSPTAAGAHHQRFSNFDPQLFALGPNVSPAQAKRALEAHLSETDRRMEEAGKLGTALVQQRKELNERLREVEKMQAEGELSQDLRQKLIDIEKEYNEVARESARAFLPKQRVPSNEAAPISPLFPEGKGGRRSVSPSKFEAQATNSPTKLSVPNRKIRNQPANRVHDIEFAAEISTSLIAQVRNLQALLAEKEEELKEIKAEKSRLQYETENFQQRVKALDENEHRYKDENWNLETQLHELTTAQRDAAEREKKLTQSLNLLQADKNATQQKLDEVRLSHSKLIDEHAAEVKRHDIELGTAKRNMVLADSERGAMQRKIEELTTQNQELAKAISLQRGRMAERDQVSGTSDEDFETANDNPTPEHSPPPSPIKGTPRHSMLETETLKTSLGHAQRTIQSLRANYHREKTEKLELRRMLHEARDEVEKVRNDPVVVNKRARKAEAKEPKKPAPRLLGGVRTVRSEIITEDDSSWEDQPETTNSSRPSPASPSSARFATPTGSIAGDNDDHFETANDTSDAAFETANERGTETDDFHTGAEDFSSGDDTETETESPSKHGTLRLRQHNLPIGFGRSGSIDSTASTDDEEDYYHFEGGMRTPPSLPPLQPRFPLRVSRGAFRRSRQASEEPALQSSPSSFTNRSIGTPKQHSQSLAAELGDFEGSDDNESNLSATPSRRSIRARTTTPPPAVPALPRLLMVDSSMMTEPVPEMTHLFPSSLSERPMSRHTVISRHSTPSLYTDAEVQENLDKIPPTAKDLALSTIHSQDLEPLPETDFHAAELAAIRAEHAEHTSRLIGEHATAEAAALESLRAEHAEELRQLSADHATSLAASSEALEARHAEEIRKAEATVSASFTQEIEALKSSHAEEISKVSADALAAHAEEVNALKATHAKEIDALKAAHAEQLALRDAELKAAHAAEIEALAAKHSEEMATFKKDNDAAHAAELEALQAKNADELSASLEKVKTAHAVEIEALHAKHSEEVSASKKESDTSHAVEFEALQAKHLDEISSVQNNLQAAHATEVASLKDAHSEALSSSKSDSDATRAAEIAELTAVHAAQIEQTKSQLADAHTNELEAIKASHAEHVEQAKNELIDTHAKELGSLRTTHEEQIELAKNELTGAHVQEIEALKASFAEQIEQSKIQLGAAYASEIESLKASHAEQLETLEQAHSREVADTKESINTTHSRDIESLKESHKKQMEELREESKASHAAEIAALVALHTKELGSSKAEGESTLSKELSIVKDAHTREIDSLKNQYSTAHAQELEGFKAALAKQIESSKVEGDVAHNQQLEALNAAHVEILESHKRENETAQAQALDALRASHDKQIDMMKSDLAATKSAELAMLAAAHSKELEAVRAENESSRAKLVDDLTRTHSLELETALSQSESMKEKELAALRASHTQALEALNAKHDSTHFEELEALKKEHAVALSRELEALKAEKDAAHAQELEKRQLELQALEDVHEATRAKELEALKTEHAATLTRELKVLEDQHQATLARELQALADERDAARGKEIEDLNAAHAASLAALRAEQQAALDDAINNLKAAHTQELDTLTRLHDTNQAEAIEALKQENLAERERLLENHAAALETLRKSLSVSPPTLAISSVSSVETEPVETPGREAFILPPREIEHPRTPQPTTARSLEKSKAKADDVPLIAEDETRQSPSMPKGPETPESQRPFKEISANADAQARRKATTSTTDHGAQTTLTAESLEHMFKHRRQLSQDSVTIVTARGEVTVTPFGDAVSPSAVLSDAASSGTVRVRRSQESLGSITRAKHRMTDSGAISTPEPIPARRPGSSASARTSAQPRPPLPANHREAIEAARTTSSSGGKGTMGPPSLPASAYKNPTSRPWTPSSNPPVSPPSVRGMPTPRAGRSHMHSPTRIPVMSSQSSVSSFVSEIDTRFNMQGGMGVDTSGFGPNTDPRMIQAITQTMIGEYLWKYTRKAGREEMSENRHRRYFWVHPYTRTLNWSDTDPSAAAGGRSETKAKSVPIEAVRVVTDDNPMPPGLHRKSLIIVSPGRTVKFTCTTGQRHETWFNALSYLLLRTGEELEPIAEDAAGNLTQDDVDEFNPSIHR